MVVSSSRGAIFSGSGRPVTAAQALVVLAAALLTGCGITPSCGSVDQPYQQARENSALRIPPGMDAPNRSAALNIPAQPESAPVQAVERDGRCLDEPPSYFGTALSPLSSPEEVVAMWAQAWSERNVERMMAAYSQRFEAPDGAPSAQWLEQRREQAATGPVPVARVQGLRITQPQEDRRVAAFTQRFAENSVRRELTLVRENGFWRILAERAVDVD